MELEDTHIDAYLKILRKRQRAFPTVYGPRINILDSQFYSWLCNYWDRKMGNGSDRPRTGKATRLSILASLGPPLDKVVAPAPELLHRENRPPAYRGITYKEYIELHRQTNSLDGKSCLTRFLV
ncbi:hypothetical protein LWI28_024880 [Acer negundo]|uniref:Uncharacterized protein n=1 Tax=Acer negundo TaxID=4023 RepID=A0AAD5JVV9_ACENE|nr:hypothetical protein LWI28_024880 [Acer negundo]